MNNYFRYADLPHPPFIESYDQITNYRNYWHTPEYSDTYASYGTDPAIVDFYQDYFDKDITVRYQVIKKALPRHTDWDLPLWKYNYLITTGGDVKTQFWSDMDNDNIVFEIQTPVNTWHELNVGEPHSVTAPTFPRISLVIRN